MCKVSADQILAAFLPMSGLRRRNLTFCALLNLTKVLLQDDEVDHKKQKTENGSNGAAAEDEGEEEEDAEEEEDIDGEEEEDVDGEGEEDLDEEEGGEGETHHLFLLLHKRLTFQLLLYTKHNEVLQLVVHASKTRQTRLLSFHQSMYPSKAIFGPLAKVTCIHTQVSRVKSEITGALKCLFFPAPLKHS